MNAGLSTIRVVVMLSGSGSTLQNFIDLSESGRLPIHITKVISSRGDAYGLQRAQNHNIPTVVVSRKKFNDWADYNQALTDAVNEEQPDLVLFAGFMSLFWPGESYSGRIMNVHPALIPAFCGKGMYGHHIHEAVIETGAKITGCTVHFVDGQYDTGPIILQRAIEVYDDDTPDTLAERVQEVERQIYPEAVNLFVQNRLQIENKRVKVLSL
ncbi:MAG: phosphoribosylglycinamide formyltransferase [Candidatus Hinthialibacter antarcticus]|nr:phosphoribosylglycinamide formyltransferase [Candidatus Hinthialibacter antarcticus]